MQIAFALLAHGHPDDIGRLIRILVGQGHLVVLHYDRKAPQASFERLRDRFAGCAQVRLAVRVAVHWGEWSVVQGTLNCLDAIEAAGWDPTYVYHLSGMDYPIRSSAELTAFLERNNGDEFIETVAADTETWVKTGPQRERYRYRWPFNWREQQQQTEICFHLQKWLGLERGFVRDMTPFMGSQWWVLTWRTLKQVMALARTPDIVGFFRTTLIADELFFQTLVRHLVAEDRIVSCPLTHYQFSDYGYPILYHADHYEHLLRQNFFMARKISLHDPALRDRLDAVWSGEVPLAPFPDESIGEPTLEYDDWRTVHRDGVPGRPVPGRSQGTWYEDQKRVTTPWFAVLGTSTLELRAVHRRLARQPGLLCHGQVFHPALIEFAGGSDGFAGYGAGDTRMRDVSAPCFVTDLVGAEPRRLTGMLLRWKQGHHIPELAVDRPNVRVLIVDGDPFLAFAEELLGPAPLLADSFNPDALRSVPPCVVANRFRRFLSEYDRHAQWLAKQFGKGLKHKPQGWIVRTRIGSGGKDWFAPVDMCLELPQAEEASDDHDLREVEDVVARTRNIVQDLLLSGGIRKEAMQQIRRDSRNLGMALALL
jgi:hypothetical protein